MKKAIKTLFLVVFGLFAAAALAVVIAPTFFKDKLIEVVKTEINKQVEGEVDFKDIDVTWWSTFPDVSLQLDKLRISGQKPDSIFQDLLYTDELAFTFDFKSVWSQGDSLEIQSFTAINPNVFIYVDDAGVANYDLAKKAETASTQTSTGIKFDLSEYKIEQANIRYIDKTSGTDISLEDVNHTGDLTYENDQIIWGGSLESTDLDYVQNSLSYISNGKVNFDGKLNLDLKNGKYTFLENDLALNALELFFDGNISQSGDNLNFDVDLKTRKNTFKSFLSVLPNMYASDFDKIDVKGNLLLAGSIDGTYNGPKGLFPKYVFNLKVDEGWFRLPDKSQAISDIFISSTIKNASSGFDPIAIAIPDFMFTLNGEKIDGNIDILNQGSNQLFDGKLKGKLNLADIQKAYPMESITQMSGIVDVDATFKGNTKAIAANDLSQLEYSGFVNGSSVIMEMKGQPTLNLQQFKSILKDDQLIISSVKGSVGQTDFDGVANVSPLSVFLTETSKPLVIQTKLKGRQLHVDEWMTSESNSTEQSQQAPSSYELLRTLEIDVDADYDKVVYEDYKLENIEAEAQGSLQQMHIKKFNGKVNNDAISASGDLKNIYGYTFQDETLEGKLKANTNNFDVGNWMVDETETNSHANADPSYAVIPKRMDLLVAVNADKVKYEDIDIRQAKGNIVVQNQRVSIGDFKGRTMGGNFDVDGYYAHDGSGQPLFKIDYDLSKFSFEKTFQQVEMAQALLPIIKFIKGTFNTNMSLEGALTSGYMPDLSSIDGIGLLETLHGDILNNATLNKISNLVNLDELKKVTVDRTKNKFSIQDGTLSVDPFNEEVAGIFATISGKHKLTGDMSYKMALTIPTEKFNSKGFPIDIKKQFENVQKQLNKFGIPLNETESIRLDVFIEGSITDPKVRMQLVDFSKQSVKDAVKDAAKNLAKQAKDSITNEGSRKIIDLVQGDDKDSTQTTVKQAVKTKVKKEVDKKIEEEITPVKDTIIAKAEEQIKEKVGEKIGEELGSKVDSTLKNKGKEILGGFFKKKKKE